MSFFFNFECLKRYSPCPSPKCGEPKILTPMPPGGYVPVCQKLTISKYSHVTPYFKGNFMWNQYFGSFNLFSESPSTKMSSFVTNFTNTLNHSCKFSATIGRKQWIMCYLKFDFTEVAIQWCNFSWVSFANSIFSHYTFLDST